MRLTVLAAIAAAVSSASGALAQDSPRPYGAVVCTAEANGPWAMRAQGTLTRTKSEGGLVYRFDSNEHSFDWRLVTSPQGHTTASGPGYLMERFAASQTLSRAGERRQSIEATGEIREYAGQDALVLLIGSKCPNARRAALRER